MELKKNPKIEGTRFRTMFRHLGFIIAISLTITAFEWKFEEVEIDIPIPLTDETWKPIVIESTTHDLPERPKPMSDSQDIIEVPDDTEIPPEVIEVVKPKDEKKSDDDDLTALINNNIVIEKTPNIPILVAEVDAVPEIGLKNWYKKVNKYCQTHYSEKDKIANIKGRVYVSFIIEKDGSLTNIIIKKGISKGLDKLAFDAVRNSGKWKSAKQGGRRVRLIKNLPINFN